MSTCLKSRYRAFRPDVVAVADETMAEELSLRVNNVRILYGPDGINQAAVMRAQTWLSLQLWALPGFCRPSQPYAQAKTLASRIRRPLSWQGAL